MAVYLTKAGFDYAMFLLAQSHERGLSVEDSAVGFALALLSLSRDDPTKATKTIEGLVRVLREGRTKL